MDEIKKLINELVGDTSVARQLDVALRSHRHDDCPTREEYEALKQEVERLSNLVGDTSVAVQINNVLNG
jgi:hypothetical protein